LGTSTRGTKTKDCEGTISTKAEAKCGRPLGLQIHHTTGDLYIADAYFGLMVVGPGGGVATRLVAGTEKVPFGMTNGVDVDPATGVVYFTDSSTEYKRRSVKTWLESYINYTHI
jgi:hypothetical protein